MNKSNEKPSKPQPIFQAWKKQDQDEAVIKAQRRNNIILASLCVLLAIGWMTAPSRLKIFIPPALTSAVTQKAGEIPKPSIYSFAYQVWQGINYWPQTGDQDYKVDIRTNWYYLSSQFQSDLLQDETDLKSSGQLQRQRFMEGVAGEAYDSASVKQLSSDTWEVDLKMRLTEYSNHQVVKDVEILYPLKVIRMNVSEKFNPYGLVLAGFVSEPQRLKVYV
jgi:integrating conjugative element protein (TIGR03746 family)